MLIKPHPNAPLVHCFNYLFPTINSRLKRWKSFLLFFFTDVHVLSWYFYFFFTSYRQVFARRNSGSIPSWQPVMFPHRHGDDIPPRAPERAPASSHPDTYTHTDIHPAPLTLSNRSSLWTWTYTIGYLRMHHTVSLPVVALSIN